MADLLSDHIAHAIGDPGNFTDRLDNGETVIRWQARAVCLVLVRGRYLDDRPVNPAAFVMLGALMFVLGLLAGWGLL